MGGMVIAPFAMAVFGPTYLLSELRLRVLTSHHDRIISLAKVNYGFWICITPVTLRDG
jgi:hypothetical protein